MRWLIAGLCLVCQLGQAQDDHMYRVQVKGDLRSGRSYQQMWNGAEAFAQVRAQFAPAAELRFRIYDKDPEQTWKRALRLSIESEHVHLEPVLGADNSFALPLNEQARREDALLLANRPSGTVFWKPYVVTPGLPPHTRRLGDLRAQCMVSYAANLVQGDLWDHGRLFDQCLRNTPFSFLADGEIFAVTMRAPGRERHLFEERIDASPVLLDDWANRVFDPMLRDRSWPDDTLIELDYVDSPGAPPSDDGSVFESLRARLQLQQTRVDALSDIAPRAEVRNLSKGRRLWVLRQWDESNPTADVTGLDELALLFNAAGVLEKYQFRAARVNRHTGYFAPDAPKAAGEAEQMMRVEVPGEFSTEQSYRRMLHAVELFDQLREHAPKASLRFRLYGVERPVQASHLHLSLEGESFKQPLTHDADAAFVLPLNEKARREDAALMSNRRTGTVFWKPYVMTPGLPADTRRLGDLRVQCRLTFAANLEHTKTPNWFNALFGACGQVDHFGFLADREVFAVTVRAPGRERHLLGVYMPENSAIQFPAQRNHQFAPPLGETDWTDDSQVQIHYVDSQDLPPSDIGTVFDALRPSLVPGQTRKADLDELLKRGAHRNLEQKRELWTITERKPAPDDAHADAVAELVLLFDGDGILRLYQIRAARVGLHDWQITADPLH